MANLSTTYMGLTLPNPLIVASCSLVKSPEGVRRCADAGVGAVVLKSLFEEQMKAEMANIEKDIWLPGHPEAFEYVSKMGMAIGPREYLQLIKEAKGLVSIPIIASLNCISPKWWADYAKQIEAAGADALELNISAMPSDPNRNSEEVEQLYFRILEEVKARVDIPIAVKIGSHFTSLARVVVELCRRGVSALVLFNRFYQLDIDIEKLELIPGYKLSSPHEMNLPLRWIALLAGRVDCDLAASTGVHDGAGAIKQLLAGATAVQLCSTLYLNGLEQIGHILEDMEIWLQKHGFESLDQMRGMLSQMQSDNPELYERLQYIKTLVGIE
jgi:dihydroorotate dehydrogenase (fumarate)